MNRKKPTTKTMRRRRGLLLLLLLLGVGCFWHSNAALEVERVSIPLPALPEAFDGLTIAQVSDLHGGDTERLLSVLAAQAPDIIAVTGDLTDKDTPAATAYAAAIGAALSAIAPTYYVTGNHEWATRDAEYICSALEAAGVTCLRNEALVWERAGQQLVLAGVDDPNGYADQKSSAAVAAEVYEDYGPEVCWLLLAHRNDRFVTEYAPLGPDLTLSGHGHGGIIRLPLVGGLVGTDLRLFPDHTNGLYQEGQSQLFVSRGLGNVGNTRRLFNPFHLPVITLCCE